MQPVLETQNAGSIASLNKTSRYWKNGKYVLDTPLNKMYDIDSLLLYLNRKLSKDNIFEGSFNTNDYYKLNTPFCNKTLSRLYYIRKFLLHRVIPKLHPNFRRYYLKHFFMHEKHFTKTEILGRLVKYGFEIEDVSENSGVVHFVARKKGKADISESNLWPVFRMDRVGKQGQLIKVYKFRTMHPFAEYLQDYMFKKYGFKNGDKIENDFRVSSWGKVLRKYWIDEVPMLINLFRGEMKLVGPRPISAHKFNLYSKELQELRTQFKPGILPPFYADLPKNLEELQASEYRYLQEYKTNSLKTDWKYLCKIAGNILFRKARSA